MRIPMTSKRPPGQIVTVVMAGAMIAAPFLALIYSAIAGLTVMAIALLTTVVLARGAVDAAPIPMRRWLHIAVAVNIVLAVACLAAVVWLIARR